MIELSNGHRFEFCCASGALAFDGRGWPWEYPFRWVGLLNPHDFTVVAKTVTLHPRKGNLRWYKPWGCVRLLKHGNVVNAVGLTNPGISHWIENGYRMAKSKGYKVAASVAVEKIEEASDLGELLADLSLAYIEFNASCPNTGEVYTNDQLIDAINRLHGESGHPIVVKISYDQACDTDFLQKLGKSYAQAIHCINTVPWKKVYSTPSPLEHLGGGGVSGPDIFSKTILAIQRVKNFLPETPIIAGGGISDIFDLLTIRQIGVGAFSIGTLFLKKPWAPNRLIKEYNWAIKDMQKCKSA